MNEEEWIGQKIAVNTKSVAAVLRLLDEGSTVVFIARYRKEASGGLDEVICEKIRLFSLEWRELVKRKAFVLSSIEEQNKLTNELRHKIEQCFDALDLEELYLPYKQKRKTRATMAREKGLEPLALWLLKQYPEAAESQARRFLNADVSNVEEALSGARDIIAEMLNEDEKSRSIVKSQFESYATLQCKVIKSKEAEAQKFRDYFDFNQSWKNCPPHRVLAMFRGEEEGVLRLKIAPDSQRTIEKLERLWLRQRNSASAHVRKAIKDGYDRLLEPSVESIYRNIIKQKADEVSIEIFTKNLRQLLLGSPLGTKAILAIDPGFRTGCKVVCLSPSGDLMADTVIFPLDQTSKKQEAETAVKNLVRKYNIEAIAIGNGTAGRETEDFVRSIVFERNIDIFSVNESGASVYSASEVARDEFPDKDITVRGAVSIGRRLADPLAELVKIDPKSIGVGQYQHDVDQAKLKNSLDATVMSCVNYVGVDLNTASASLLTYVSGIGPALARNIVEYRKSQGAFSSRQELLKVARLGAKAFEQSAGFLRIRNAKNPLDNSAVHPEAYGVVEKMAKSLGVQLEQLVGNSDVVKQLKPEQFADQRFGIPTVKDILEELKKPGRDPRQPLETFQFARISQMEELSSGMILPGIVTNITAFGCFVNIGIKQEGLVHISEMSHSFIKDPSEAVSLQQHVQVKVLDLDFARKRIALSIKQANQAF